MPWGLSRTSTTEEARRGIRGARSPCSNQLRAAPSWSGGRANRRREAVLPRGRAAATGTPSGSGPLAAGPSGLARRPSPPLASLAAGPSDLAELGNQLYLDR